MPTLAGSDTQAATVGTEHTLHTVATAGSFVLVVDTADMVAGDVLELRVKYRVLTGGTVRTEIAQMIHGLQHDDQKIWRSIPVSNDLVEAGTLLFTLKQTFGTSRNFPWKVVRVDA